MRFTFLADLAIGTVKSYFVGSPHKHGLQALKRLILYKTNPESPVSALNNYSVCVCVWVFAANRKPPIFNFIIYEYTFQLLVDAFAPYFSRRFPFALTVLLCVVVVVFVIFFAGYTYVRAFALTRGIFASSLFICCCCHGNYVCTMKCERGFEGSLI